jgi:integrase
MKYRSNFIVFPRKLKSGRTVFYYQTYDEHGVRTNPRSTGQTSKTMARKWCESLWAQGELVPAGETLFSAYTAGFFIADSCPYIKRKLSRAADGIKPISDSYIAQLRSRLLLYILPYFGSMKIDSILPKHIESWLYSLKDEKKLAHKTLNGSISTLRIIFAEAKRDKLIKHNPCDDIDKFAPDSKSYQPLTIPEARELLHPMNIQKYWKGETTYYCINLLAATTGMRMGECRGLLWDNYHGDHIYICQSYGHYGLGPTKNRETRYVTVAPFVQQWIEKASMSESGFVFSYDGGATPVPERTAARRFHEALETMGI